ncbi:hypothetical protein AB0L86_25170 [Micromonospora musae]|uniref:hypothetical protein n=1 Tax=Micromonospora musae TaxID=1894970 RepID=UPI003430713E
MRLTAVWQVRIGQAEDCLLGRLGEPGLDGRGAGRACGNALTDPLDTWLASAFTPHRIQQTITGMAEAQPLEHPPGLTTAAQVVITECDAQLERYRAALDAGADPTVVTGWIAQTQAERARAEVNLRATAGKSPRRMSGTEITSLVTALGDIATVLRDADPADKAKVYRQLGLRLTYQPKTRTVRAAVDLSTHRWVMVCVRGKFELLGASFVHDSGCSCS